jgi:parallel beta-helix repeat protein
VTVADNEVHHCYTGIFSYEPNYSSRASVTDAVVRGNHCTQNLDAGISLSYGARRILIEGNRCEFNAISHISTHHAVADVVIRGNVVAHAGHYTETMEWPGSSALNAGFGIDGLVIENNRASFQLDPTGWDGNGIIVDTNDDLGAIDTLPLVRNNVLYRNQGSGITITRSRGCTVVHNTCVENGYAAASPDNGAGVRLSQSGSVGTLVANNLFAGNAWGGLWVDSAFAAQSLLDHNLYDTAGGGSILARDSTRSYTSLAALRQSTAREQHGVQASAAFVGPTDFHLSAISPAIGAATAAHTSPADYDSTPRDAAPDLGAFEYVAPPTYATWRAANFTGSDLANDAISGPNADPDAAGVTNIQRYAFGLAARGPVAAPTTLGTMTDAGQTYLTLTFNRRTTASDLSYIVEGSTDLVNWATVRTYAPDSVTEVVAEDSVALGTAGVTRRFLRVRLASP